MGLTDTMGHTENFTDISTTSLALALLAMVITLLGQFLHLNPFMHLVEEKSKFLSHLGLVFSSDNLPVAMAHVEPPALGPHT